MPTTSALRFAASIASITPVAMAVVGGQHAVDLREALHQVLHHLQRLQPLIVAGLRRQQLDVGSLLERLPESAHPVDVRQRGLDAFNDHDVALAAHRLEHETRGLEAEIVVIGADEGNEIARLGCDRSPLTTGILAALILLTPATHRLIVDRRENDALGFFVTTSSIWLICSECCRAWSERNAARSRFILFCGRVGTETHYWKKGLVSFS